MGEELCVIFNPHSGRGRAAARLDRLRAQWGSHAAFWPTEHEGHGEDLALRATDGRFTVVAAAGGDGTVHEVANGLLRGGRPDMAFAVVPIGSANDYAFSLGLTNGTPPPAERWVDVGVVHDGRGRERHFVCCLGLGFNGKVTLEARRIKRLQGIALYGLATLRALWYHYACPPLSVAIDDQPAVIMPTLMLSVLVGRREGGFVMAPNAQLDDGLFDYVHTGDLSRLAVLRFLPRLALAGPPQNHPKVHLGRCRRFVLQSPVPLTVHIDGEFFARPEDDVRKLDIQIVPKALRVVTLGAGR
jgi:diacylglycerol kinase family enzyme